MLRALLLGFAASVALAFAAGGAEAKAPPQCKDAKGRVVPCPQKSAPAPQPSGSGGAGAGCVWLIVNGSLVPCYAV